MATIEKRRGRDGKLNYRVKIRRKGAPQISETFQRLTDARGFAQRIEAEIAAGKHIENYEGRRHTLKEAIIRYLDSPAYAGKAVSTQRQDRQELRWWVSQMSDRRLSDITPAMVIEHRDKLAACSKPATVNRYLASLRFLFTLIVRDWEWLDDSPMRKVSNLRNTPWRVRFLSDDERVRLLHVCKTSTDSHLYPLVVLAISTGGRQTELLTLRWQDVDFPRRVVTFHKTKNRESRSVPLTSLALDVMREYVKIRRIDSDFVFPAQRTSAAAQLNIKAWHRALEAANIQDFRFHDLRHTAASYLAMNGASLLEIAQILGHKSVSMTQRYAHLTTNHTAGVVERMNQAVFGQ